MAQFIYIDETGSVGTGSAQQPYLTLVAVIVHEDKVRPLAAARKVAFNHLGWLPDDLEFHGHEIWGGTGWWSEEQPPELIAKYEAAIALLDELDISLAHSCIDKARLHARYGGSADANHIGWRRSFSLKK